MKQLFLVLTLLIPILAFSQSSVDTLNRSQEQSLGNSTQLSLAEWERALHFPTKIYTGMMPLLNDTKGEIKIMVFDMWGRELYKLTTQDSSLHLELAHLEVGIYVIRISDKIGQRFLTKKFIIGY